MALRIAKLAKSIDKAYKYANKVNPSQLPLYDGTKTLQGNGTLILGVRNITANGFRREGSSGSAAISAAGSSAYSAFNDDPLSSFIYTLQYDVMTRYMFSESFQKVLRQKWIHQRNEEQLFVSEIQRIANSSKSIKLWNKDASTFSILGDGFWTCVLENGSNEVYTHVNQYMHTYGVHEVVVYLCLAKGTAAIPVLANAIVNSDFIYDVLNFNFQALCQHVLKCHADALYDEIDGADKVDAIFRVAFNIIRDMEKFICTRNFSSTVIEWKIASEAYFVITRSRLVLKSDPNGGKVKIDNDAAELNLITAAMSGEDTVQRKRLEKSTSTENGVSTTTYSPVDVDIGVSYEYGTNGGMGSAASTIEYNYLDACIPDDFHKYVEAFTHIVMKVLSSRKMNDRF